MKTKIILALIILFVTPLVLSAVLKVEDPTPTPISQIYINEVELNPYGNPDVDEWVEIYNDGPPVNLSGWYVTDRDDNPFFFPDSIIDTNGFFVLDSFPDNSLVNNGENVSLYNKNDFLIDNSGERSDPSSANDQRTWSRVPDGIGSFVFQNGTKGFSNVLNESIPPINITISDRYVEPACRFIGSEITLKAKVEGECVQEVIFSVNVGGTWMNFTATKIAENYTYTLNKDLIQNRGYIEWNVFAKDCYNRIQEDGIQTFMMYGKTSLFINPTDPDGLNGWYINEPKFTLENSEASDKWYMWDSSGIIHYNSQFGLEDAPNSGNESGGIFNLKWFSSFNPSCNESVQNKTFYFDLTNPVIKDLAPGDGEVIIGNLMPEISTYIDEVYGENSGVNLSSVVMKIDGFPVNASVEIQDTLDARVNYTANLSFGEHNIEVTAYDNAGQFSKADWSFEIVDGGEFNLNVYSPENGNYGSKRVLFNITTSKEVEKIEYINYNDRRPKWKTLCKECDKYERNRNLIEGWNNLTIRATNEYGQVEEKNILLFVDSKKPIIYSTLPTKNKIINGDLFYIKYSEDNLQEVKLFWNGSNESGSKLLDCSSGRKQECNTSIDLSSYDGEEIEFWFEVSDSINTVITKRTKVFVDITPPILSINMPKNATYQTRNVPINISASENVKIEYIDSWDERPKWKKLCSNCDDYGIEKEKTKTFRKGIHNLIIKATDEAGNFDEGQVEFFVDY